MPGLGGGMHSPLRNRRIACLGSAGFVGFLFLSILLGDIPSACALPLPRTGVYALPAFARKYGMPCSSCHEAWPKLSPFGQSFKDNGYQMGNERDAPIFQQPAYWPVTFRITPTWHRESQNRTTVDDPAGPTGAQMEARVTTHGFDWTGLDFHTAGTLAKNISFYVLPSSNNLGQFHFEAVWTRFNNLLGTTWLNVKVGKFELDNLLSEKRILTLSQVGGLYQNYHFQPPGESSYVFGIGDNQVGAELMGHSKNDRTRYSAALLSSNDGNPGLPSGRGYNTFLAASHAFEAGTLGVQRIGAFAYIGQAPTYFQYKASGANIAGTGIGNKGFYRAGLIGMWYIKKLDVTTMYFHGWDSAFLGTNTPANGALPDGAPGPTWTRRPFQTQYTVNPQLILINRYELIRMSRQAFVTNSGNLGNLDALTFGYRYYPFISSRAGFAFHNEFARLRQRGTTLTGLDMTTNSLLLGFDFAF